MYPKSSDAYILRGNAYYDWEEYAKAFADYNEAIRFDPNYPYAYVKRGYAYCKLGKEKRAIRDFRKAVDLYIKQNDLDPYNLGYQEALRKKKRGCTTTGSLWE